MSLLNQKNKGSQSKLSKAKVPSLIQLEDNESVANGDFYFQKRVYPSTENTNSFNRAHTHSNQSIETKLPTGTIFSSKGQTLSQAQQRSILLNDSDSLFNPRHIIDNNQVYHRFFPDQQKSPINFDIGSKSDSATRNSNKLSGEVDNLLFNKKSNDCSMFRNSNLSSDKDKLMEFTSNRTIEPDAVTPKFSYLSIEEQKGEDVDFFKPLPQNLRYGFNNRDWQESIDAVDGVAQDLTNMQVKPNTKHGYSGKPNIRCNDKNGSEKDEISSESYQSDLTFKKFDPSSQVERESTINQTPYLAHLQIDDQSFKLDSQMSSVSHNNIQQILFGEIDEKVFKFREEQSKSMSENDQLNGNQSNPNSAFFSNCSSGNQSQSSHNESSGVRKFKINERRNEQPLETANITVKPQSFLKCHLSPQTELRHSDHQKSFNLPTHFPNSPEFRQLDNQLTHLGKANNSLQAQENARFNQIEKQPNSKILTNTIDCANNRIPNSFRTFYQFATESVQSTDLMYPIDFNRTSTESFKKDLKTSSPSKSLEPLETVQTHSHNSLLGDPTRKTWQNDPDNSSASFRDLMSEFKNKPAIPNKIQTKIANPANSVYNVLPKKAVNGLNRIDFNESVNNTMTKTHFPEEKNFRFFSNQILASPQLDQISHKVITSPRFMPKESTSNSQKTQPSFESFEKANLRNLAFSLKSRIESQKMNIQQQQQILEQLRRLYFEKLEVATNFKNNVLKAWSRLNSHHNETSAQIQQTYNALKQEVIAQKHTFDKAARQIEQMNNLMQAIESAFNQLKDDSSPSFASLMSNTINRYFDQIAAIKLDQPLIPLTNNQQGVEFSAVTMSNFQGSLSPNLISGMSNFTFKESNKGIDSLQRYSPDFQNKIGEDELGNQNPLESINTMINRIEDKYKLKTNNHQHLTEIPSESEESRRNKNRDSQSSFNHSKNRHSFSRNSSSPNKKFKDGQVNRF